MIYNKREYQEVQKSVEIVAATAVGGITGATLLVVLGVLSPITLTLFSSKLPKSKKNSLIRVLFFCLFNRSKWSEEHIIMLDIDIDNIVESIWCISNIPNSEDDMIT